MNNNDLLKRLRYALRCDDADTAKLITEGGSVANASMAAAWRIKEGEPGYTPCSEKQVAAFLSGLILDRRGPPKAQANANPWDKAKANKNKKAAPAATVLKVDAPEANAGAEQTAAETEIDNNVVLKQLRIALKLRSDNLHQILKQGGSGLTESEANALFRSESARNFRRCGDQVLRQFLAGLAKQREADDARESENKHE